MDFKFVAKGKRDFVGLLLQWHSLVNQAKVVGLTEAHKVLARRRHHDLEMASVVRIGFLSASARRPHRTFDAVHRYAIRVHNSATQLDSRCWFGHRESQPYGGE